MIIVATAMFLKNEKERKRIFLGLTCFWLNAESEQNIFDAVLRGHIDFSSDPWPSISSSAKDIVKKMLRSNPKERLTALEVLSKFLLSA